MNNGPRKGGAPATVKLLRSIPSIQAAYQLHRNAATSDDDNTDPSLIANKDAAEGEFIRVGRRPTARSSRSRSARTGRSGHLSRGERRIDRFGRAWPGTGDRHDRLRRSTKPIAKEFSEQWSGLA